MQKGSVEALPTSARQTITGAITKTRGRKELESVLPVDLLALEVGLDLLPLVDTSRGGELLGRIGALRKQLASDLGILVVAPDVHRAVSAVAMRHAPGLAVVSYREIDARTPLITRRVVGAEEMGG